MATEYVLLLRPAAKLDEVVEMLGQRKIEVLEQEKGKIKVKIPVEDDLGLLDQMDGVISVIPV